VGKGYTVVRIDQEFVWNQICRKKNNNDWFDRLTNSLNKLKNGQVLEMHEQFITNDIKKYVHLMDETLTK